MKKTTKELTFHRKRMLLAEIKEDDALAMRVKLDDAAIDEYAKKYLREKDGATHSGEEPFPLAEVVGLPDGTNVLVHGRHRFKSMGKAAITEWDFLLAEGTIEQAAMHAAKANLSASSVRYTHADKQHAVRRLLAIMPKASSRVIADCCGVHHSTVEKYRNEDHDAHDDEPRQGRDGRPVRRPTPKKSGENSQSSKENTQSTAESEQSASSDAAANGNREEGASSGTSGNDVQKTNGGALVENGVAAPPASEVVNEANPTDEPKRPQPKESKADQQASRTIVLSRDGAATRITVDGKVRVASVSNTEVIIEVLAARATPPRATDGRRHAVS